MNDRGFTLLELLVAITILSLAVGSTVLFIPNLTARAEIRQIATRLDRLLIGSREEALRKGAATAIRLDPTGSRLVRSGSETGLDIPANASVTIDGASTAFGRDYPGDAMILFLADGSSSGGLIDIRMNGLSVKRRVSWITGRINAEP